MPFNGQPFSTSHDWTASYVPDGKIPPEFSAHVPFVDVGGMERIEDRRHDRVVHLVELLVVVGGARVEQDHAIGVHDRTALDHAVAIGGTGVPRRQLDGAEFERDDRDPHVGIVEQDARGVGGPYPDRAPLDRKPDGL